MSRQTPKIIDKILWERENKRNFYKKKKKKKILKKKKKKKNYHYKRHNFKTNWFIEEIEKPNSKIDYIDTLDDDEILPTYCRKHIFNRKNPEKKRKEYYENIKESVFNIYNKKETTKLLCI